MCVMEFLKNYITSCLTVSIKMHLCKVVKKNHGMALHEQSLF